MQTPSGPGWMMEIVQAEPRLLPGNEVYAGLALAAGCKFYGGSPISPPCRLKGS